jgi:hypothetical protein
MRVRRASCLVLAVLLVLLATGAPSALASGKDVIRDCTDDEVLTKTYTQKEYKDALGQLAGDTNQYGNCQDVIRRAQLKALRDARAHQQSGGGTNGQQGGTPGTSGGGGSTSGGYGYAPATSQLASATPDERKAVDEGRSSAGAPVNLQGVAVNPGIEGTGDLPAPLVVLLGLVLAGAIALAAVRLRARGFPRGR